MQIPSNNFAPLVEDIEDINQRMSDIGAHFMGVKGVIYSTGDIADGTDGFEDGQPYLEIGIKTEDETNVKTYLTSQKILKSENENFVIIEYEGKTYPLVIVKNASSFNTQPRIIPKCCFQILWNMIFGY